MKMSDDDLEKRKEWAADLNTRFADLGFGMGYYFGPGSELEDAQDLIEALEGLDSDQLDVFKEIARDPVRPYSVLLKNPKDGTLRYFRFDIASGLQYKEDERGKWQQTMIKDKFQLIDWLDESKVELAERG